MAYLLDSNTFIEAKQRYYDFSVCPGYWDWLTEAHSDGSVFSIEKVGDELLAGNDVLSDWVRERGAGFFLPADEAMLRSLVLTVDWARQQPFRQAAINAFADDALRDIPSVFGESFSTAISSS